jgi:Leucine-rich repeat (LRR) protein
MVFTSCHGLRLNRGGAFYGLSMVAIEPSDQWHRSVAWRRKIPGQRAVASNKVRAQQRTGSRTRVPSEVFVERISNGCGSGAAKRPERSPRGLRRVMPRRTTDGAPRKEGDIGKITYLKTLDLSQTKITDAGLKELSQLKGMTWLQVGGTAITDAGVSNLIELSNIKWLDLSGTKITDVGLNELKSLKNLVSLSLHKTQTTDVGENELKESLPNLKIQR